MKSEILLEDDFLDLSLGMFSTNVGPLTEYHYIEEAAPKGNWSVACFYTDDSKQAWKLEEVSNRRIMRQCFHNTKAHTHPMLAAGDPLWENYTLKVKFKPEEKNGRSGIVFRYVTNRKYYFLGFDKQGISLILVDDEKSYHVPNEKILAQTPCDWTEGKEYEAVVDVNDSAIHAEITGLVSFDVDDSTFSKGKIGLLSDIPTSYFHVLVTATTESIKTFSLLKKEKKKELEELRKDVPVPVLYKKISTEGFGVGRNLRFGDLTGNGSIDLIIPQVIHHGPRDSYSETGCITAMTFDGEILWQNGKPDPDNWHLTNDTAVQIHDIDGDGMNEVIYCHNFEIIIADGKTGQVKRKAPTPESKPPGDKYPRILGDCLFFADFRGLGAPRDIVIKDRYWHFWVLDDKLQPLWDGTCNTGHYPFAMDIDGDGKDELAIGYSLYDHDGSLLWTLDDKINEHSDGIAIVDFNRKPNSEKKILFAASDEGMFLTDLKGNILVHHYIGHVQNPAVARFRSDLPGLQTVSVNFWGNQGILHFYDANGKIYHETEPVNMGSMCLPVNWTGDGTEFFVHNPNVKYGGMFDGWGRKIVPFPDDGHPDMCNAVLDITGDCRDEVVVWDPHSIWVYTQSDNPKKGRLYKPVRNSLANSSNYQATVSLPGYNKPQK